MKSLALTTCLFVLVFVLSGCTSQMEVASLTKEIEALKDENAELANRLSDTEESLSNLTVEFYSKQIEDKFIDYDAAYVSFIDNGYGVAKTEIGQLLFAVDNVVPYIGGCRIKMRIGNPYNVDLVGIELNVASNLDDLEKNPYLVTLTNEIKAGSWNSVEFNIPKMNPEEVHEIYIEANTDVLKLMSFE